MMLLPNFLFQHGNDVGNAGGDCTVTFPLSYRGTPSVKVWAMDDGVIVQLAAVSPTQFTIKIRSVLGLTSGAGSAHGHVLQAAQGGAANNLQVANGGGALKTAEAGAGNVNITGIQNENAHTHGVNALAGAYNFYWEVFGA